MKSVRIAFYLFALILVFSSVPSLAQDDDGKLRIIVFGAHPDDPEKVGGTMAKFVEQGHKVRLISMTNGNAGHQEMGGGPLAWRRYKETQCAGAAIGAEYIVMDNDDGKLMPTLENREKVIAQIREWKADVVISPRPNDYHPDHRNTGLLVRDAAYMVTVPNIVASVPHLRKNPIFIYMSDRFTQPSPFDPDIVVAIDEMLEKKIDMYHCHTSQMYEWLPYNANILDQVPESDADRREWMASRRMRRSNAERYTELLTELYGEEKAKSIQHVEAFEVSEYGSQPSLEELKKLFPFFN
ncbi:MAG: PIG-L family deacetylase [Acidobacteriota bacterium]|nr:MAG: PIG-L family deacetylase [Acidobacteriota bacterium]